MTALIVTILFSANLLANEPGKPPAEQSIYNLSSTWSDQTGAKIPLSSLRGHKVLMSMVYTSCKASCPVTVSKIQEIDKSLPQKTRDNLLLVLASFDPKRDTPKKLAEFAASRKLDAKRWRLFTGSESGARELAAVLGVKYRKEDSGEFSHSNIFTALDSQGVIKGQKNGFGGDNDQIISAIEKAE